MRIPPKARPRPHTTLDRDYLAQDTIRDLGDRFGATGPLVFLALILNAGKGITERALDDLGRVELRWSALARETFTDVATVRSIVTTAVELGLLDRFEGDGTRFSARLTKADKWESRPQTGAERTAKWREGQATGRDE